MPDEIRDLSKVALNSIEDACDKNLAHMDKAIKLGLKTLPSKRSKEDRDRSLLQHGVDVGRRQAMMYFPGADSGIIRGDWTNSAKSATTIIRSDIAKLWARSEQAYRTDPIARRIVNILSGFIVGQGIQAFPAIRMKNGEYVDGLNAQLAEDWERFSKQCIRGSIGVPNIYMAQTIDMVTMIVYGTILRLVVNSKKKSLLPFAFQQLKPTRLDFSKDTHWTTDDETSPSNTVLHGMKLNKYGEPEGFYFQNEKIIRSSDNIDIAFIPTEAEQYLGIPWMTPVLTSLYDLQDLLSDKLKQSRIAAKLGIQVSADVREPLEDILSTASDGTNYLNLDFQGIFASDGKVSPIQVTDPLKDSFAVLFTMVLQFVGIGMGVSYQRLTTDLQNANFTSGRINTILDVKLFRILFKHFVDTNCQPYWNRFVEWEALTGRLMRYGVGYDTFQADPDYYTQCFWLPKDQEDWVDPLKDAQAQKLLYRMGRITYQEFCALSGGEFYKNKLKKIVREREEMKSQGLDFLLQENIDTEGSVEQKEEKSTVSADEGNSSKE